MAVEKPDDEAERAPDAGDGVHPVAQEETVGERGEFDVLEDEGVREGDDVGRFGEFHLTERYQVAEKH